MTNEPIFKELWPLSVNCMCTKTREVGIISLKGANVCHMSFELFQHICKLDNKQKTVYKNDSTQWATRVF